MKKLVSTILALLIISTDVLYASNPFDIISSDTPDLKVNNIWQDKNSGNIYVKVCNIGGNMEETGKISVGVQRASGSAKNKYVELSGVQFTSGECKDYWIGKPSDINILTNGRYYLAGGVKIDYFNKERILSNNIFKKYIDIDINYGKDFNNNQEQTYYNNNYYNDNYYVDYPYYSQPTTYYYYDKPDLKVQNIEYYRETTAYENGISRNINNAMMIEVCNAGTSFTSNSTISTYIYGDVTAKYINIGGDGRSWPQNQCRKVRVNANNLGISRDGYFSISVKVDNDNNIQERDEYNNTYSESVYFNYYNNCYGNNCGSSIGNNRTYYCNGSWQYTSNQSGYYCNGTWYNWNDSNNNNNNRRNNNNSRVDLSVQSVRTTGSDRRIYAQICNPGRNLSNGIRADLYFYVNGVTKSLRRYLKLNTNECTDVDNYIYYEDLSLSRGNFYNINVRINTVDSTDENTSNNSIDRSLYTE